MGQDMAAATEHALEAAEAACTLRGARLTELRREVLRLVLEAGQPVGAYALLDRLRAGRAGAAPPTVYRALDFLLEQGLIHKVERLNAFIACSDAHDHAPHAGHGHAHPHQFFICGRCGDATEIADAAIAAAIAEAARAIGFRPRGATVEVEGLCAACAEAG